MNMKIKAILLLSSAALLAACQSNERLLFDMSDSINAEVASSRHAVHNMELRKVMRGLLPAPAKRPMAAVDAEPEQPWRRDVAMRILGRMALSADRIPDVLEDADLPELKKQQFRDLAEQLKIGALRLRTQITRLDKDEIGRRFDGLQGHCIACHQKFRVLPQLD